MDSNTVTISATSPNSISNITYLNNSLVVSDGQDHDPAPQTPTKDGNVWTITLNADRQAAPDVADSFNTNAGGSSHEYATSDWYLGNSPGGLNFYFGVNLTIGTETITVYLGQGSWGASHNNWWFGCSALIFAVPPNGMPPGFCPKLVIGDIQLGFEVTESSFTLTPWSSN